MTIRRLAHSPALLLISAAAPALLLALFAAAVAPAYFSGSMEKFTVAVQNQDNSPLTASVVEGLVENERTRGLVSAKFVSSFEEGQALLNAGAPALIVIPPGFQATLQAGGQETIRLYLNPARPLEGRLIRDVLAGGVDMVNKAQHGADAVYGALLTHMPTDSAAGIYGSLAQTFLYSALDKGASIQTEGALSPLGRLLPVEYYAAALLSVFLCFGAMGVADLTARDKDAGVLERELSMGRSSGSVVGVRAGAGAILIVLQGIPAFALVLLLTGSGFWYAGSPLLALPALLLLAAAAAAGGAWAGVASPGAVRLVFLSLCALALLGGAAVPASQLGPLSVLAPYTPVNAAMHLVSNTLFFFDQADFQRACAVLLAYLVLFLSGTLLAARRRA